MNGPSRGADSAVGIKSGGSLISSTINLPVKARSVVARPAPEELRVLTERMPNCLKTGHGSVNVQTRVVARSKASTFIVTDDAAAYRGQPTMAVDEATRKIGRAHV